MFLDDLLAQVADELPSAETRYVTAPKDRAFAVWDVAVESRAADDTIALRRYEATVSLVEPPAGDRAARAALEKALDAAAVDWSHDARGWDETERVYVTDYTISWAEKARR